MTDVQDLLKQFLQRPVPVSATNPTLTRPLDEHTALPAAFEQFLETYPAYRSTRRLDVLRNTEYARLDHQGQIYLDYTGGSLYAETQLYEHMTLLRDNVFGNPHSTNPTSQAMTELVERTRATVRAYLHADPNEYEVIFTPNASGALRLVGEAYPFAPGGALLLSADNHNSVNGLREFARTGGAPYCYAPLQPETLRLVETALSVLLAAPGTEAHRLFAYPAQSNFSGVHHPLEWIEQAQAHGWDVLLDAAAFLPTNLLDLSRWHPEFVSLSFYKLFGYPTGVGALIARRSALAKLQRPWFAGGTIQLASVLGEGHIPAEGAAGFEDGTVNYLSLPAVAAGLCYLTAVSEAVHTRVMCLTNWLLAELQSLRHGNGAPLVQIHGPTDIRRRGATIALTMYDAAECPIDYCLVEQAANAASISLRTGCFCNPGAAEYARGLTQAELAPWFQCDPPPTREHYQQAFYPQPPGAVRVSLGIASNFADVYAFGQFVRSYLTL